jgi:NAD(P)-dependent dehydrogenase (short-subunit alcohol dehydrogenase family)
VEAIIGRFGSVDILVNNAATNPFYGRLVDLEACAARKTVSVNQYGPVAWAAAWHAWMAEHGGSIVNISANGAYRVAPGLGWYESTKAALIHLTEQLAFELAPSVRVNAIAPGLVKTELSRALWWELEQQLAGSTLTGRLGEPEDIAEG